MNELMMFKLGLCQDMLSALELNLSSFVHVSMHSIVWIFVRLEISS